MAHLDRIYLQLDRVLQHYRNRLAIIDKRWDKLQDAVKIEEEANGETDRYERLSYICGRADTQHQEMSWRIEHTKRAYNTLEEIDISVDNIRQTNLFRRKNKVRADGPATTHAH